MRMAPKLLYELKTVAKIGYNRNRCIPDTMVREWQRSGQWCGNHRVPGGKLAPAQFRGCGKFAPTYIEAETNRLGRLKSFAPVLTCAQFGVSLETQWHKMKEGVLGLLEPRKIIIIRIFLHPWPANTKGFAIKL